MIAQAGIRLYFLRHGRADRDAYDGADDDLRPLTPAGRDRLRRCLPALLALDLDLDLVLSSPLTRARQTAGIVAAGLGRGKLVAETPDLGHGFSLRKLAELLAAHRSARRIMLVGHEPSFSQVIGDLTGGRVVCRKGSLARVDMLPNGVLRGELVWLLQPRILLAGGRDAD